MPNVIFSLQNFKYVKSRKEISAPIYGLGVLTGMFPAKFSVASGTGKVVDFVPVGPDHPAFDQDHWDGEQQVYCPTEYLEKLDTAVIYSC